MSRDGRDGQCSIAKLDGHRSIQRQRRGEERPMPFGNPSCLVEDQESGLDKLFLAQKMKRMTGEAKAQHGCPGRLKRSLGKEGMKDAW